MAKVFIDGEAGTTGLQIRERLESRADLELITLDADRRKDLGARTEALNGADVAILCLPDDAAKEAVTLVTNPRTKIIDASTAHRVADGWIYGFPEMSKAQRARIAASTRITNPGCYPTGFIALVRPLVEAGVAPRGWQFFCNAVSGYSGGGKAMIAEFEDESSPTFTRVPYRIYAVAQTHKHVPEMRLCGGLSRPPIFTPAVGRYYKGMIVEVPLAIQALPEPVPLARVHEVIAEAYAGERFVEVASLKDSAAVKTLDPEGLNNTNKLKLFVFGHDGEARLVALLDNLGKGASGAAVQNLNIALGLDEGLGL